MPTFTVTIAGPERHEGHAPYTYVIDAANAAKAQAKVIAEFKREHETEDVIHKSTVNGVPANGVNFHWNDLRPYKVIFRKHGKRDGGEVFALFPEIASTVGQPHYCQCYAHVGQHCAADPFIVRTTKPATPAEYKDLAIELQRRGYHVLRPVRRFTRADYEKRKEQCRIN